jgi:micrococcal nuclease
MSRAYLKRLLGMLALLLVLALPAAPVLPAAAQALPSGHALIAQAKPKAQAATITKHPGSVRRNSYATAAVKTAPNGSCTLTVRYKSGPSKAAGVGTKRATANGAVSWTWKVGGNTTKGTWPVTITCGATTLRTSVTVP